MVNPVLFKSSLIFGTIQLITMIALESNNILFNTSITFGIVTSVINHGTTSKIAKWMDRLMMLIGIYIDIYVIENMLLPPNIFTENEQYLFIKPYLSSNWERDLYYYIYYPYVCYYFLSLSILSFIMSKCIESIFIKKMDKNKISPFQNVISNTYQIQFKHPFQNIILSCHITAHLLLTITHILIMSHPISIIIH